MKKVLILGCGPAGLIAARTAQLCGAQPTIYSHKVKSPIFGAQWIHEPLPGITSEESHGTLQFITMGTAEGFAEKIFGDRSHGSSWHIAEAEPYRPIWDLRTTYDVLWENLYNHIVHKDLDCEEVARLDADSWDAVFNCIPLWNICRRYRKRTIEPILPIEEPAHRFDKYKVLIRPSHPTETKQNVVIYNGREEDEWFRTSKIFGVDGGYEYPITATVADATMIRKPQSTNCDCFPHIIRVGRYGAWDMEQMTNDAYTIVKNVLED